MSKRILCLVLTIAALVLAPPLARADGEGAELPAAAEETPPDAAPLAGAALQAAKSAFARTAAALDTPCFPVRENNRIYYLGPDGKPLSGWRWVSGRHCFFTADGRRASGWTIVSGKTYYFGPDGAPYTGLRYVRPSKNMYLFSADGALETDTTVTLLGKEYHVDRNGLVEGYLSIISPLAAAVLDDIGWDLRAAFDWAASMPYFDRNNRAPDDAVHTDWYAQYGFSYRFGNCYVMAASFYQMAKLLGYEVYYIEGGVGSATGKIIDHGWTEIVIDGQLYVFDPDFTSEEHLDGYQIWYEKPGTWWYFDPVRVD